MFHIFLIESILGINIHSYWKLCNGHNLINRFHIDSCYVSLLLSDDQITHISCCNVYIYMNYLRKTNFILLWNLLTFVRNLFFSLFFQNQFKAMHFQNWWIAEKVNRKNAKIQIVTYRPIEVQPLPGSYHHPDAERHIDTCPYLLVQHRLSVMYHPNDLTMAIGDHPCTM